MGLFMKFIRKPISDETHEIPAIVLWYVRWTRRFGDMYCNTEKVMEAFPNKDDADAFADSLRAAYELLQYTGEDVNVTVTSNE